MKKETQPSYGQLEKQIITILAEGQPITTIELQKKILQVSKRYTVQAIYYVLRKLRRQGIVLKIKSKFSINITWALDLLDLAKQIENKVIRSFPIEQIVPKHNQSFSWTFSNLITLDDFWVQLMLVLFESSNVREMYNFCPHPWFYYAHQSQLDKFYSVLMRRKSRFYVIVGGNSYLDKKFISAMSPDLYNCIHDSGDRVGGSQHKHVMLIGDYIITVQLNAKMTAGIERCFTSIRTGSLSEIQKLQQQINQPTRARLKVTHNHKMAQKLRSRFIEIYRGLG